MMDSRTLRRWRVLRFFSVMLTVLISMIACGSGGKAASLQMAATGHVAKSSASSIQDSTNAGAKYHPWQAPTNQPSGNPLIWVLHRRTDISPNDSFNILIVPDSKFGDLHDPDNYTRFRAAVDPLVNLGLGYNAAFARNMDFLSVYFTTQSAEVETVGSDCPQINFPNDVFNISSDNEGMLIPDMLVVVHQESGVGHCAWQSQMRTVAVGMPQLSDGTLNNQAPRIMVHELGHTIGLPDEYSDALSYYAAPPVLYVSKEACESDPDNEQWRSGNPCKRLRTADGQSEFWRSEQFPNIMSAGGEQVVEFGPAGWVVVRRFFEGIAGNTALVIHDPKVFAPDDWNPLNP